MQYDSSPSEKEAPTGASSLIVPRQLSSAICDDASIGVGLIFSPGRFIVIDYD